jgi:hypothetical protein
MAKQVEVQTFLEGFDDPLLGYISFEKFEDPIFGLEALHRLEEFSGRAVGDPRRGLEATPDIEEIGPFHIEYREPNRLLEAFHRELPATVNVRKRELDGTMLLTMITFKPH